MRYYYKHKNDQTGMLAEICDFGDCHIGSMTCSECKYCLFRDVFEKYIICSKLTEKYRLEKLKNILDENY
jgi:hypothetical protein